MDITVFIPGVAATAGLLLLTAKPVPGYPGHWADVNGDIWSSKTGKRFSKLKPIKTVTVDGTIRFQTTLRSPAGTSDTLRWRHIILWAHAGQCPDGYESRCLDGNSYNNSLSNLAWSPKPKKPERLPRYQPTIEERFWSKVDKTSSPSGCWLWTAGKDEDGYGRFFHKTRTIGAHVVSRWWDTGRKPKLCVMHSCDNPPCVNPAHLSEGTNRDNQLDAKFKGRNPFGVTHGMTRLRPDDVRWIREHVHPGGVMIKEAAARFGVSNGAVQKIRSGINWRHLI